MAGARPLDAAVLALLDDPYVKPVFFAAIEFDDGTVYLHDDLGTITFGANDYLGVGNLGSVEGLEERSDGSPAGIVLRLSALSQTLLDEVLLEDYFHRPVTVYLGFRNIATGAMIVTPWEQFHGHIDDMAVSAGQSPSIAVMVETELQAWDRPLNSYFSDSENQRLYAGALGAKYMAAMANRKITIGNKTVINVSDTLNGTNPAPRARKKFR